MTDCKCPNCGARLKVALFNVETSRKQKRNSNGVFHSTQPAPPTSGFLHTPRAFLGYLTGRYNNTAHHIAPEIVIESIVHLSTGEILRQKLKIAITEEQLQEIADVYIRRDYSWSKASTTRYTSLSQKGHDNLLYKFLDLMFLEVIDPAADRPDYRLTFQGKLFLRRYL